MKNSGQQAENTMKAWKNTSREEDRSSATSRGPAASQQASENNLPRHAQLSGIIKAPQLALP